jgi:2-oxoisovalerate dehydrogenase E1 component
VGDEELAAVEREAIDQVEEAVTFARGAPFPAPETLYDNVYARPVNPPLPPPRQTTAVRKLWVEAVADGLAEEMRRQPEIIYLGCGIGKRGGCWGQTKGLWQEFGGDRVIDAPISEFGFTGAAIGAAMRGGRGVADLMFAGFLFDAASQIVNQAAKLRYVSNGQMSIPAVVRAACGYVSGAAGSHGGTCHCVWSHVPGLIVVVPSNPADAKGLMKTALRAADPVVFLDHLALATGLHGDVPVGEDVLVPFGRANVLRQGTDLTIISAGMMVHRSLQAAERLAQDGVSCELIDLRTIVPLDVEAIVASVAKTGRALVVDEDWAMCGLGGEIAALTQEHLFGRLRAPVGRICLQPVTRLRP